MSVTPEILISFETAASLAHSNREWDKVYQYLVLHPKDFFAIPPNRRWPIAHQVVFRGDVDRFKRMLASFSDDQIDIRTASRDYKTLLDVAIEQRQANPQMYTYVEHLFALDELMEQAKQSNWRPVTELLEKNNALANEKPPYSPCFLLHYVVQNGDAQILQDLLGRFQFLTNVLNIQSETPLDMAIRLNKDDICTILRTKTLPRRSVSQNQPPILPTEHLHPPETYHTPMNSLNQPPPSVPTVATKSIDPKTELAHSGSQTLVLDITEKDDSIMKSQSLNSACSASRVVQQPQIKFNSIPRVNTNKSIVCPYPSNNTDSLIPPPTTSTSSNQPSVKHLTCTLTGKLFVDPVIASDGRTYERAAILERVNTKHSSPATGAPMDATFREDVHMKDRIQQYKNKDKK
jgi:hypothetical protein